MTRSTETKLVDCLERIKRGEATVEEVLSGYPELRGELEPLLSLAAELRSLPKVAAPASLRGHKRPEFPDWPATAPSVAPLGIAALRRRWPSKSPSIRWAAPLTRLAAGVAVAFLMLGGGMMVSAGSLPEEPLYPVKLAVEGAQLAMAPSPQARVDLEMQFAERRLAEAESAAEQGRAESLERGMALYEERVEGALQTSQPAAGVDQGESIPLQQSLDRHQEQLSRIYERAPEPAQPAILHAMEVSQQGHPSKAGGKKSVPAPPARPAVAAATPAAAEATGTPTAVPTRILPSPTVTRSASSGRGADDEARKERAWKDPRANEREGRDKGEDKVDKTPVTPSPLPSATSTPTLPPSATPTPRASGTTTARVDAAATATLTPRTHAWVKSPTATATPTDTPGRDRVAWGRDAGDDGWNRDSRPGGDESWGDSRGRDDRQQ